MSIEVALADLAEAITSRGPVAYLVTVSDGGPRVVSVGVEVGGDPHPGTVTLTVGAGRHSAANVGDHPQVTLFWPVDADHPKHTLLVDGTATVTSDGDRISISPTAAVLHRVRAGQGG